MTFGEFIDIIEWLDESRDTMVWRFPRRDSEIKNGAQLIVRPGQSAILIDQGRVADEFGPGRHVLATSNLPLLSKLRGWKYGFESPFKADVVFVNATQFTNRKWGTSNPVIVRDPQLGPVRLRAFGTFAVRVEDPACVVNEIAGTNASFTIDQIDDQLRDLVIAKVSAALAEKPLSIFDLAGGYAELGDRVLQFVAPQFKQYGLEITQLIVENVSLPAEVEAAIDSRATMGVLGNLDQYTKLQTAEAIRDAARNANGSAGAMIGVGMLEQRRTMEPLQSPPPVPREEWYYVVSGERRGPTDLAGLQREAAAGVVRAETLVWKSGMSGWMAAKEVGELQGIGK